MRLAEISSEQLRQRFAPEPDQQGRLPGSFMADALRAHAHVLGPTLRRTLVRHAAATLEPLTEEAELGGRVDDVLGRLLSLGDLTGPHGARSSLVAPAPLRAVSLAGVPDAAMLVGGGPTDWLRLAWPVDAPGLRVVRFAAADTPAFESHVNQLGGIAVSLDAWSRRTPHALEAAWLEGELARLSAEAGNPPALDGLQVYDPRLPSDAARRWRRAGEVGPEPYLVRGRDERGYWRQGIGSFSGARLATFASVHDDLSCELRFALDRRAGNPATVRFERPQDSGPWTLVAPFLPRAEHRVVRALSFLLSDDSAVRVDPRDAPCLKRVLASRLGVQVIETTTAAQNDSGRPPSNASSTGSLR